MFRLKAAPWVTRSWKRATSFYFDTALTGTANGLDTLLKWAPKDHTLFGSDYPYAPNPTIEYFTGELDKNEMDEKLRAKVNYENAPELFPRLKE